MEEWPSILHVKWAGRVLIPKEGASNMRKHGILVAIGLDCKPNLKTICANLPEETTRCQCSKNASTALAGALQVNTRDLRKVPFCRGLTQSL